MAIAFLRQNAVEAIEIEVESIFCRFNFCGKTLHLVGLAIVCSKTKVTNITISRSFLAWQWLSWIWSSTSDGLHWNVFRKLLLVFFHDVDHPHSCTDVHERQSQSRFPKTQSPWPIITFSCEHKFSICCQWLGFEKNWSIWRVLRKYDKQ